jgi:DNA-binding IclR family transcriptional regulator
VIAPCVSESIPVGFGPESNISSSGTEKPRRARDVPARYRAQVLTHSLRILDLLAQADRGVKVGVLATHLSLHRSTIHRLLSILEHQRFVRREPGRGGYELGMKLFELGRRAVSKLDLSTLAAPVLDALARSIDRDVSVLDGNRVTAIAIAKSPTDVHRVATSVTSHDSIHASAAGKVVAAYLPDDVLHELIKHLPLPRLTATTVVGRGNLRTELMRVRRVGFAFEDEEVREGVRALSVPVRNYAGRVVASLTVVAPKARLNRREISRYVRALTASAADLSQRLGFVEDPGSSSRGRKLGA